MVRVIAYITGRMCKKAECFGVVIRVVVLGGGVRDEISYKTTVKITVLDLIHEL
jgi:hypothetical protein